MDCIFNIGPLYTTVLTASLTITRWKWIRPRAVRLTMNGCIPFIHYCTIEPRHDIAKVTVEFYIAAVMVTIRVDDRRSVHDWEPTRERWTLLL